MERPAHSPLGASGAERWVNCPGSVTLLKQLELPESDEEDWRAEGIALHEAAAHCLRSDLDAWEITGETFHDTKMVPALVNPVQTYLDFCRSLGCAQQWVEYAISSPIHPLFYGTLDFAGWSQDEDHDLNLHVVDLKGGMGVLVEPERNPQLMYYAFGIIDGIERQTGGPLGELIDVHLTIAQPRMTWAEPIRTWPTTIGEIKAWAHDTLIPAMLATETEDALAAGPWCRFCPAKLVCPLLTAMFGAAARANPKHVEQMTPERLGLEYEAMKAVKMYMTALERMALQTLMRGEPVPLLKLVRKKANRAWKPGAPQLARERYGDAAFTKPELMTPAALEQALPAAKDWVKEMAFTPDTGYTVALASDPGVAQTVTPVAERFSAALEALKADA